jgi:hypothetical protein
MKIEMCLYQFLKKHKNCKRDLDENNHPNNRECPLYKPIAVYVFDVQEEPDLNYDCRLVKVLEEIE